MQRLPSITRETALFLDFDGTLAELAPRPDAVRVAQGLIDCLAALHEQLDGALAIVSGRRLADLDDFLRPLVLPAAGEHGAQQRSADGRVSSAHIPDLSQVLATAQSLVDLHPGLLLEPKSSSIALHYRHCPNLEPLCRDALTGAIGGTDALELLEGKCVLEVKARGVDKGAAIRAFMAQSPFTGRTPLFAGDDVTDEAGFVVVQAMRGVGIKVGQGDSIARHRCDSPLALRSWLQASIDPSGTARNNRSLACS
jgi:trehalose 6-phosphate phosphatase